MKETLEQKVMKNNPIAFQIIKNSLKNFRLSHLYLFASEKNNTILDEPLLLIQEILEGKNWKNFPDLIVLDGLTNLIKKESIINAIKKLNETPLDSLGKKILFIKNIENANKQSLNSLLKFIEEPPKNTFIIMTTNNVHNVLSTIRSRSQIINIRSISLKKIIKELENQDIQFENANLLAQITFDIEESLKINNESTFEIRDQVINLLSKALINPSNLFTELSPLILKNNYRLVLSILRIFYSDIWKYQESYEVVFLNHKKTLEKYLITNFNFAKALKFINDFLVKVPKNVNFDLYKNRFLIELESLYV